MPDERSVVDPIKARRTEIRGRLQELATQSMSRDTGTDELKAIGKEAMALWSELDQINAREETPTHAPD